MQRFFITILAFMSLLIVAKSAFAEDAPKYSNMPAGIYKLDPAHASLVWKVSHMGLSDYTARFTNFDAEIDFDPSAPEKSMVTATINPMSVKTDYPFSDKKDFDKKLSTGAEWFNAGEFPKITFKSTKIMLDDAQSGKMTGDLTFLGVTKPVTLDVTFNGAFEKQPFTGKPTVGFSAKGLMKRSEWGFATYVPNIGDEVALHLEVEFAQDN
ncbi:MAG: YceI family protein [Pseudomonadota bacterium]